MRRIYNAIAISLTAILMACTHPEQGIRVETVEVKVPVATPCVDKNAVPAEPGKVGDKLNGNAAHDADLLASSAITLRQWGKELTALISPCLKP